MLVLLTRSPFQRQDYRRNLQLAMTQPGSEVILIQDAVLALHKAPADYQEMVDQARVQGINFYALAADLEARGLDTKATYPGTRVIDYGEMVDLAVKHGKVL
ncbi:sulfurtransferase complex subunit TusB [Neomoorella thermoacetica]|uniref:Protein TusB n=3 Tax=Neomoorella thermoacetica TaxID=1525 RepID=A0A1D7X7F8_NEOTH|nr:sulfurtransferase complex subunit TusB [Moorella thermoacetica]AKX93184.1 protein TusB [Moorella thermoacetica]AKX95826.1 protein TusB [Moorella thermoacetica]AOQ22848.1 Protein TusB [Moorella thermoacetica]APC07515.1 protein TusB [Moorella thermoacetica]OIQ08242.1 protein TusB [Moorella thermoacetica]